MLIKKIKKHFFNESVNFGYDCLYYSQCYMFAFSEVLKLLTGSLISSRLSYQRDISRHEIEL